MAANNSTPKRSVLIINPNTTNSMTNSLKPLIVTSGFNDTHYDYFTAPSGVPSINNEHDAAISADACLPGLQTELHDYDAFLVCCYSQHPLVPQLRHGTSKPVTGIFEASVATCLQTLDVSEKFGIVSTGSQWTGILSDAVAELLGSSTSSRYVGTETTGLNADELHSTPKDNVDQRMKGAVKELLRKGAKAICLGCAGMAGMDEMVRGACVEELGEEEGKRVRVVDGVVSGVVFLEGAMRAGW